MDVKRRRGPKPEIDPAVAKEQERAKIEARTTEQWIDEGSVRAFSEKCNAASRFFRPSATRGA